jgi:hypothetical protein
MSKSLHYVYIWDTRKDVLVASFIMTDVCLCFN